MYNNFSNIYLEQFSVKEFTTLLVDSLVSKIGQIQLSRWYRPLGGSRTTVAIQFERVSLGRCAVDSLTRDVLLKLDWMIGSTVCPII